MMPLIFEGAPTTKVLENSGRLTTNLINPSSQSHSNNRYKSTIYPLPFCALSRISVVLPEVRIIHIAYGRFSFWKSGCSAT